MASPHPRRGRSAINSNRKLGVTLIKLLLIAVNRSSAARPFSSAYSLRGVAFVNVGRGKTVDEETLVEALKSERLSRAALDVFEEEPLPEESPLWELPNVILSPTRRTTYRV